jgi:two-component system sensor histidine kinase MprB
MAAAVAVAVAVVLVALVAYFVVRNQLLGQVDNSLRAQATLYQDDVRSLGEPLPPIPASAGGPAPYVQVVLADGSHQVIQGGQTLPVTRQVTAVAAGTSGPLMTNVRVDGSDLREVVFKIPIMYSGQTVAVQVARPVGYVEHTLANLRLVLILLCAGGIGLAAVLGRLAARRVLAPLGEVAATAQHISETEDLRARIQVRADDEVGQLATRFNTMLERLESSRAALDESVQAQRQLVADASHELRTPVTSLRTNIELLLADENQLSEAERRRMLADVVEQSEELSFLVGDLIELARGDLPIDSAEDVELDQVVAESVDRARRNFPGITVEASLAPTVVEGVPERLGRAVNNLLDNAARHSPPEGVVEVRVDGEGVTVRDHGAGIDESDLPHVFERFYRGAGARGRQGSGLGLAIVRQVAEQHGGSVSAENAPDGGALFTLRLPVLSPSEGPDHPDAGNQTDAGASDSDAGRPDSDPGTPDSGAGRADDPRLARRPEALA